MNIDFIVSPYSANAQITYLWRKGLVSIAITEDLSLLAFGCGKILIKLDSNNEGK
jgi:exonuclease 1